MSSIFAVTSASNQKAEKTAHEEVLTEPESPSEPETLSEESNSAENKEEQEEDAEGDSEEESDGGACWNCKLKDVRCVWAK